MSWFSNIRHASSGTLIAYHATVSGAKILAEGFKTRDQLSGQTGLGGGSSNSVSLTTDWHVAKGIFDSYLFASQIASSPNPLEAAKQNFQNLPPDIKSAVQQMVESSIGDPSIVLDGWQKDGVFGWSDFKRPMTLEQLQQAGFRPYPDGTGISDGLYYNWIRPQNPKETNEVLYSYLKAYHYGNPNVYNPLFFGTGIEAFKNLNRNDIGIITAEIEIDPNMRGADDFEHGSYRYVGSMAEIRIYDLSTIKRIVDFDNNPGPQPKHTSDNYFSPYENVGEKISLLCKTIIRNRDFLESRGISSEAVISLIQHYGHKRDPLARILSSVLEKTKLSWAKYELKEYQRFAAKLAIPADIQNLLNRVPEPWREKIMQGNKAEDVLYELYEVDSNLYDQWWISHADAYDAEKKLNEWSLDYKYNLKYLPEFQKIKDSLNRQFGNVDAAIEIYNAIEDLGETMSTSMPWE